MKNLINKFTANKKIVFTTLLIFTLILIINCFTIWAADDYAFYNNVWTGTNKFSLSRIFIQSKWFYLNWTGRFLSTFINYFLLYFPKWVFNILNSTIYTILVLLIYKFVKKEKQDSPILLFAIFALTWIMVPALGQVMFWQIGSVIYLWMYLFVIVTMFIYSTLLKDDKIPKSSILNCILISLLGLFAGNGFETNSIILLVFLLLTIFIRKFVSRKSIPIWAWIGSISAIIGSCTNFFSPGNSVRMKSMSQAGTLYNKIKLGSGPWFYNGVVRSKIWVLIIAMIAVYIIYAISCKKRINNKTATVIISSSIFTIFFVSFITYSLNEDYLQFLSWFYTYMERYWHLIILLGVSLVFAIIITILYRKDFFEGTDKNLNRIVFVNIISALVGLSSYIMTPLAWPRSYMGMSITMIIAILFVANRIKFKTNINLKIIFIVIFLYFGYTYTLTFKDTYKSYKWHNEMVTYVKKHTNSDDIIMTKTFVSTNSRNAASVEKWVIPVVIDGENVHPDYEWINIAITKYYFKDLDAWNKGKRIIGEY
ncbi:MAG: hypothetical protein IKX00_03200 [Bacilli bacterium]|nr:hypothetical protein [Bacilli bacterium]